MRGVCGVCGVPIVVFGEFICTIQHHIFLFSFLVSHHLSIFFLQSKAERSSNVSAYKQHDTFWSNGGNSLSYPGLFRLRCRDTVESLVLYICDPARHS